MPDTPENQRDYPCWPVWMLDRYRGRPDHSQHVYFDESCMRPLTAEQYAAMPKELRDICEMEDRLLREARDRRRWGDDW